MISFDVHNEMILSVCDTYRLNGRRTRVRLITGCLVRDVGVVWHAGRHLECD